MTWSQVLTHALRSHVCRLLGTTANFNSSSRSLRVDCCVERMTAYFPANIHRMKLVKWCWMWKTQSWLQSLKRKESLWEVLMNKRFPPLSFVYFGRLSRRPEPQNETFLLSGETSLFLSIPLYYRRPGLQVFHWRAAITVDQTVTPGSWRWQRILDANTHTFLCIFLFMKEKGWN